MAALLTASAFNSQAATPQINVGTMFDYMQANSTQLLKRVRNSGGATAFVRVEISRMHFDASGEITETPVDAAALARSEPGAQGLIASPSRMIVPANNGQQATRLVFRGNRDSEQYYRIRFVPVVPEKGEFSLTQEQSEEYKKSISAGVNVFTGYGTMVFVAPTDARYDTHADAHQVRNQGNATVVLENLRQCAIARPDNCSKGTRVHLFPGQAHILNHAPEQFSRYQLIEGGATREFDSRR
ncbi:CS1 fimbrial subunit B flags: Precursor [Stenotrophomonas geniculata]|uniref:CS1 fimbrial subunit B flags: Precursor n=1 Tax=Stenotrophomonas geniculata TaxID=86188 RepID=UPI001F293B78|nr:CS1 fimbrial subunit B flags: Precursor [Stenotrophomonas geniculata]